MRCHYLCDCLFSCLPHRFLILFFFFFNDTATTEIYTLSLHDALPISIRRDRAASGKPCRYLRLSGVPDSGCAAYPYARSGIRSEEHTSELQSHLNLVCRLLLEKKNNESLMCYNT